MALIWVRTISLDLTISTADNLSVLSKKDAFATFLLFERIGSKYAFGKCCTF